jgi:tetratricopeptide (TPR) repeat protein
MPKKKQASIKLTRQQRRGLDIEIEFLEGLLRRDPDYVDGLRVIGDDYTRRGRYLDGLKIDEQLARLRPKDPLVFYNLACSCSLMGEYDRGFDALERALNLGYRDFRWLAQDPDLDNLRQHPQFRAIRAKVKSIQVKDKR